MELCRKYCGCHQMAERSFFLGSYQFPLCARCTGIAIGHAAAFLTGFFYTLRYSIALLGIPLALDGTIQYFTSYRSDNRKRLVTGILYGFAFTSVIWHIFRDVSARLNEVRRIR